MDSSGAASICGLEKKVKIQIGLKAETRCDWRATENVTPWETYRAQSGLLLKKRKKKIYKEGSLRGYLITVNKCLPAEKIQGT